jgi:hypothetical protein
MRRSDIERENRALLDRQRQFRSAADVVMPSPSSAPSLGRRLSLQSRQSRDVIASQ